MNVPKSGLVVTGILVCAMSVAHAAIPPSERAVLDNLYVATDGAHWFNSDSWGGPVGTECAWHGITCNSADTSVVGISLPDNGLYGVLPQLMGLPNLETFDVGHLSQSGGGSETDGTVIPLPGKTNKLYGPIPALNSLKKLKTFVAEDASFSGGIPSLTGMINLQKFKCVFCGLNGTLGSLSGLTNLQDFIVVSGDMPGSGGSPGLSGNLPTLAGLSQLKNFHVVGNFTGTLPDFSGLTHLQNVDVEGFHFAGGIPDLVGLPDLQTFHVQGLLSGHIGVLSNLPSLLQFYAPENQLTGSLPTFEHLPSLQEFDASYNHLTGTIPELSGLTELQYFHVPFNQLSGLLPVPPPSLLDSSSAAYPDTVCPNKLTPASNPPTMTDMDWNALTDTTPWSKDCVPDPFWKTAIFARSNRNPSIAGQSVKFVAAVYGADPSGTVTFTASPDLFGSTATTLCDSVPLVDQLATCTVHDLPPLDAAYHIIASYSGDAYNAPADNLKVPNTTQSALAQKVAYYPFTETASANPAQIGQEVDLTLQYGAGQDDDKVSFYDSDKALCTNVAVQRSRANHYIAHCVTRYSKTGPHLLIAKRNGLALYGTIPIIQQVVKAKPFDADQFALTGPWYNPATSGQGLQFSVYPNLRGDGVATLVGGWFTFDDNGQQRWMALQGDLSASHGATYDLKIGQNSGGNFNAGPVTTPANVIGSAQLSFYDCSHAAMSYQFDDGRSGTIPYVRLDPSTACSGVVPATPPAPLPANYNDVLHSVAWYDPATSGQGLYLDLVPDSTSFFAAWFTYAPQDVADTGAARQRWFTLQDNDYTPGDLALHDVKIISTTGGMFNVPTPVDVEQVGSADIIFNSCTSMTLNYRFDQGEFNGLSGTINEQVIGGQNPACQQ